MNVYPAGCSSPFNHTSFKSSICETAVQKAVVHVSAGLFVGAFQPWRRGSGAGLSCRFMVYLVIRMELFWCGGCAAEASLEEANAE